MFRDIRRVSREQVCVTLLPEWPRWLNAANEDNMPAGQAFIATTTSGRPVLGQSIDESSIMYCQLEDYPSQIPEEANTVPCRDWRVPNPEWSSSAAIVDMNPAVDLSSLDGQYIQTVFGTPLPLFVKSSLTRARVGTEKDVLVAKLREMILSPERLSARYDKLDFQNPQHQAAFETWKNALPPTTTIYTAIKDILKRETQLQVVILLELLVHSQPVEPLLDHHFDKLCIWQAIEGNKADQVVEFCSQVVLPYFRASLPEKVKQLVRKSKGVVHSGQKAKIRRRKPGSQQQVASRLPGQSILSQTIRSATRENTLETTEPLEPKPVKMTRTLSRHLLVNQKRQVEVSFAAPAIPVPTNVPVKAQPTKSIDLSRRVKSEPVQVQATPTSKRQILLPKEPIPFDIEAVDSTDSDD